MWVQSLDDKDLLEKEMATPVFLLGELHGQESLAGYSPWGCNRGRHNLVTKQQQTNNYAGGFLLLRVTLGMDLFIKKHIFSELVLQMF